ncbi:uncharacterized protein [Euphorbia lathyris]|uniref:uncharacterized protein isoform X2 n=1 Tax=Euphorbia lathyris TaxID=212925 RepID=UPI0033131CC4
MATCNAVKISCDNEKDKQNSSKRHFPLDDGNFVNNDTTSESCLMTLDRDVVVDPPISDSLVSDVTDSQCNLEAKCSQPKKKNRKRKRKLKDKDAPINIQMDTSTPKDDSIGTNSCHDSLVEINANTDSEIAAQPVLTKSKRKKMRQRMRKKQKLNSSGITNEVHVSLADLDLPGTEENALISEKQSDSPRSPSASIVNKHNGEAALSLVEKESTKKKRRRRKRKKQNTSVINDNAHQSHADLDVVGMERNGLLSEKQSDTRSPSVDVVEKHDNKGDAAFVSDGNENIKKKRKTGKRKLSTSVITDKAHVPPAALDIIEVDENASISEKQSDSSRSPSSKVNKHNHNDPVSAFILDERENVQINREEKKHKLNTSVITDKLNVPLPELDRSEEENALICVKESYSQRTPCSNQEAARILVEKIEGKLRSRRRKRRKSSNSEEDIKPTTVAGQASTDSDELHSTKISNNEVKRVQAESKDIMEIKKSTSLNDSIEKHNFQHVAHPLLGVPVGDGDKKLLILDVNGLLADIVPHPCFASKADIVISKKSVFRRPFCDDFLQFCFEKFNVGVWSSRLKRNVDQVVDFLMEDSRHKLLFCWDQSHCTRTRFTTVENSSKPLVLKELEKLWDKVEPGLPWNKGDYNESNTLLLDDSPYKALRNPANTAIFPYSYSYKDAGDSSLGPGGDLRVYLEKLAEAQNVQEFVAHNPFGQPAITESNPSWGFYQKILRKESREKIASSTDPSDTGNS